MSLVATLELRFANVYYMSRLTPLSTPALFTSLYAANLPNSVSHNSQVRLGFRDSQEIATTECEEKPTIPDEIA